MTYNPYYTRKAAERERQLVATEVDAAREQARLLGVEPERTSSRGLLGANLVQQMLFPTELPKISSPNVGTQPSRRQAPPELVHLDLHNDKMFVLSGPYRLSSRVTPALTQCGPAGRGSYDRHLCAISVANVQVLNRFDFIKATSRAGAVIAALMLANEKAMQLLRTRLEFVKDGKLPKVKYEFKDSVTLKCSLCLGKGGFIDADTSEFAPCHECGGQGTVGGQDLQVMSHQVLLFHSIINSQFFGVLPDLGTGKTRPCIDAMCYEATKGNLGRPYQALVVAPKAVYTSWKDQLKLFATCEYEVASLTGPSTSRFTQYVAALARANHNQKPLVVGLLNYDGLTETLVNCFKAASLDFVALDESSYIKNPSARRTKMAHKLRDVAKKRVIITGSLVTQSVPDSWAQFEFLEPGLLGYTNVHAFRSVFGSVPNFKQGNNSQLELLKKQMAAHSFHISKDQCLDLPPKVYEVREVEMSDQQADLYEQMLNQLLIEIDEASTKGRVTAQIILVKLLRLAQITSGFLRVTKQAPELSVERATSSEAKDQFVDLSIEPNVKLQECLDCALNEVPSDCKQVFWARFQWDIEKLYAELSKHGRTLVLYGGSSGNAAQAIHLFNQDDSYRFFVANPATGGWGIDLLGTDNCPASYVHYYSNDWSYQKRFQSESRSHRRGVKDSVAKVTYFDWVYPMTIDEVQLNALRNKQELSQHVQNLTATLKNMAKRLVPETDVAAGPKLVEAV